MTNIDNCVRGTICNYTYTNGIDTTFDCCYGIS